MFSFDAKIVMNRAVQRAVQRATPKNLRETGRYLRGITRSLVKQRKDPNKSSAPGTAPHSHKNISNPGFKRTIAYGMDGQYSVVIGPKLVRQGLSDIARVHEFGGRKRVKAVPEDLRDGVNIGDEAPVSVKYLTSKDVVLRNDPHTDPRTGRKVVWIRIRTKTQAQHSNRLFKRMNKKYGRYTSAYYPARPYMRPALMLGKPKLSRFWSYSVKSF